GATPPPALPNEGAAAASPIGTSADPTRGFRRRASRPRSTSICRPGDGAGGKWLPSNKLGSKPGASRVGLCLDSRPRPGRTRGPDGSAGTGITQKGDSEPMLSPLREAPMRATILVTALTALLAGCGFDPAPTAPDETTAAVPEPALGLADPQFAAAVANPWVTKAPIPGARGYSASAVLNGLIFVVAGSNHDTVNTRAAFAYTPGT